MFRHLRTKLTFAYGIIMGAILVLLSVSVQVVVQQTAKTKVREELNATLLVFEQLWEMQRRQLTENAETLAQDFGFRAAVATEDIPTISSALYNLKDRLGIDRAFVVYPDDRIVEGGVEGTSVILQTTHDALRSEKQPSGIVMEDETTYKIVATPIMAPTLVGWVIFAEEIDEAQLNRLEKLSSIPVNARISGINAPSFYSRMGQMVATTQLQGFGERPSATLSVAYPLSLAMKPYNIILIMIAGLSLLGLLVLAMTSWAISKSVTEPISQLDMATRKLAAGDDLDFDIRSTDEIGRLSQSFGQMAKDIKAREAHILELSLSDPETGLPNRRALEQALVASENTPDHGYIFCGALGISRLPMIRSAIGNQTANQFVGELGRRLMSYPGIVQIGRIASDVIGFCFQANDQHSADTFLNAVNSRMRAPININGVNIDVDVVMGITQASEHKLSEIDRAFIALNQARTEHHDLHHFNPDDYGDPSQNLSLMSEMMGAMRDGSIYLTYQPKMNLKTRKLDSAEALIRWEHNTKGMISPDHFIPFAEETGHITPLSLWVLRQAMKDRKAMLQEGFDLRISVNISGRLITDSHFIVQSLEMLGDESSHFCFEVTETAVISDPQIAMQNIQRLREAGVEISIDDYGSGLSSLSYLKQINADELKIDKEFILDMDSNESDYVLVKSTIELAHNLGMKVTAEGIETQRTLARLTRLNVSHGQGYYISKPLPLPKLLSRLQAASKNDDELSSLTG